MKPRAEHQQVAGQQQNVITRTRQDMINTGELFKMSGKVLAQQDNRLAPSSSSPPLKSSPDSNCKILMRDCCFLLTNLFLVAASLIALVTLIRFFQDEPLADYYEYLLTMRFHWQMIFVTCLMPLILLVPILAILHRLLLTSKGSPKSSSASQRLITKTKLLYQVLIWLLALLALIFVAPFIRSTSLHSQIKLELDKFMRRRYESEFAYRLLDDIQERYECCDHLWYRANLRDQLPLSCFVAGTNFSVYFERTCSETLSSIVGLRCYLLAACLIVILIALACLSFIDLSGLLKESDSGGGVGGARRHYEISTQNGLGGTAATAAKAAMTSDEFDRLASLEDSPSGNEHSKRYEPDEHEGNRPLLEDRARFATRERFSSPGVFDPSPDETPGVETEPIVLTRANYQNIKRERSQSPMFVASPNQTGSAEASRPIKSALKKTTSNSSSTIIDQLDGLTNPPSQFGSLDTRNSDDDHDGFGGLESRRTPLGHYADNYEDDEDDNNYAERLRSQSDTLLRQKQREQTRRSLLSVRFADEPDA